MARDLVPGVDKKRNRVGPAVCVTHQLDLEAQVGVGVGWVRERYEVVDVLARPSRTIGRPLLGRGRGTGRGTVKVSSLGVTKC